MTPPPDIYMQTQMHQYPGLTLPNIDQKMQGPNTMMNSPKVHNRIDQIHLE